MRFAYVHVATFIYCALILLVVATQNPSAMQHHESEELYEYETRDHRAYEEEEGEYDDPEQFIEYHRGIRTADDETSPSYKPGFKYTALQQARQQATRLQARMQSNGVLAWTERGPANVPGRTRGLIVDPDDASKNTWYAGSAGGGVWKTTNAGALWTNITPDLSNLATTVLAMAESNHNVIYLGTGEGFGNVDHITGNGMFKSTDRGVSWDYLPPTIDFANINRIIVDPSNENTVVVAADWGIFRSTDGGTTWNQSYSGSNVQDLKSTPGNFQVQYAARNGVGVLKSIDGGISWSLANTGMSPDGRIELAVSPVNTNRVFASVEGTQSGSESDLFVSDDGATTWSLVNVSFNGNVVDFLGGQGWYDNTIACDPFNAGIVYVGGSALMRVSLGAGSTNVNFYNLATNGTTFLDLISATSFNNGTFNTTDLATVGIQIRFGAGRSQKAHRFLVPVGATSGVPDANYSYADYVTVPFEVWDITNNKQLMISFRDQDRNGAFNLKLANTDGAATDQSREYLFIHNIDYNNTTPAASIAVAGGQVVNKMYDLWPVLASGGTWDPANTPLPTSTLTISLETISKKNATTTSVVDVYNALDGKNNFVTFGVDVHPDQHNMMMIPVNNTAKTYKILLANDGGLFLSNTSTTPGINEGDWTMVGNTYNTSQFYGADKRPGKDEYLGGMQDNGTWRSPSNITAAKTTNYVYSIGGDGFEVLWHSLDDQKLIGGSQNNGFLRSVNGGSSWSSATTGLSGTHPFISKLAHSKSNPDVIFTVSSAGVFKSTDFGATWTLKPISQKWAASTFLDVEVSRANANIVWAGAGMTGSLNLHVSIDGGETFTPTTNYTGVTLGRISRLASHPFESQTAYALFAFADKPKILRTTNLGQSWEDISGFGSNAESSTGFPDVAVYCLYVRTDDPNILWAGTEIGIVESLDNGASWHLLDEFPNVSVWDMKGQDNQIVLATHGRGIWTATVASTQQSVKNPTLVARGTSPKKKLKLRVAAEESFDSIEFVSGATVIGKLKDVTAGNTVATLDNVAAGNVSVKMIAYKGSAPFHTQTYSLAQLNVQGVENNHITYFSSANDIYVQNLTKQGFSGAASTERKGYHTNHGYSNNTEYILQLLNPIKVAAAEATVLYKDVAILEPGSVGSVFGTPEFNDYVVLEASRDGLDWTPLADGYNARYKTEWLNAFTNPAIGTKSMLTDHSVNMLDKFAAGDTVLIRFRVSTNASVSSWGWALDYVAVQQQPTETENEQPDIRAGISVYPNPSKGSFSLAYEVTQAGAVSYEVVDAFGRAVAGKSLGMKSPGSYTEEVVTDGTLVGPHLLVLRTRAGKKITRIIFTR